MIRFDTRQTVVLAVLCSMACGTQRAGRQGESVPPSAVEDLDYSLFLIGDAGHARPEDPTIRRLTELLAALGDRVSVIFLGDNVYPAGLPAPTDPYRTTAEGILEAQIEVARDAGVQGIVIPGNHDWADGGADGLQAIRRQERFVESRGGNVVFLPDEGCPGPEVVDLGQRLRLIVLDTQWWLHDGSKPLHPDSPCPADTPDEVVDALRVALRSAGDRRSIVVGHHPIATVGKHGGYFPWEDHIFPLRRVAKWMWFPLPILGSAYPALRNLGLYEQDVSAGVYKRMIRALNDAFQPNAPVAYVGGHDHSLQVLEGEQAHYALVSGAGPSTGLSGVGWNDRTLFARGVCGFMRIDVLRTGRVRLGVFETCPDNVVRETYSRWLTDAPAR